MPLLDLAPMLGEELSRALAARGFTELTSVQEAVLDPKLTGRDLRVTSQTGSGKTVAIGFAVRDLVRGETDARGGAARPRALVIAPTRELAHQVEQELTWLFADLGVRVVSTTGGSSARDERRVLSTGPGIVVGTPGRLLDHLTRKSIDPEQVAVVVLDEADRMLDLGFREDLRAILAHAPEGHRTHLVSATFPQAVRALADSVQENPAHVEGTRLGAANVDIQHRIVLVDPKEQVGAVVNILLAKPDEQALVFVRTRADVATLAKELAAAKFSVGSLSGEMDQVARNRAMSAFKRGTLRVLVATDVAARGIDVQDIAHVIHADAPGDSDTYTHRSGRTGRAGRKGTSSVLVTLSGLQAASRLLSRAQVAFRVEPVPSAEQIRRASDERLLSELTTAEAEGAVAESVRIHELTRRILTSPDLARAVTRLLRRVRSAEGAEPRELRHIEPPVERTRAGERSQADSRAPRTSSRTHDAMPGRPVARPTPSTRDVSKAVRRAPPERTPRRDDGRAWVAFRVTWGSAEGADARRIMAVVCRRGGVRGSDIGAIRVGPSWSTVEVLEAVARDFADNASVPDVREPRVIIRRERQTTAPPGGEAGRDTHRHSAPRAAGAHAETRRPADPASSGEKRAPWKRGRDEGKRPAPPRPRPAGPKRRTQ